MNPFVLAAGFMGILCGPVLAGTNPVDQEMTEFHELKKGVDRIDYQGAPVSTTGWNNVSEAEWPFFSLVYLGYAACHLVDSKPERKAVLAPEIQTLIARLRSDRISGFVRPHFGAPFDPSEKRVSVLFHGHYFCLLLQYRRVTGDVQFDSQIRDLAGRFVRSFAEDELGILPSYPGMWWPTDNLPALAALREYDRQFGTGLAEAPCAKWLAGMQKYFVDPSTGLICGYIDPAARKPVSPPRGVGIMFAFPFLRQVDPGWAAAQYGLAKKHLVRQFMGFYAVREFPEGVKGTADVDSGELVMGFGPAASGFGIGAAAAMGDRELRDRLVLSKNAVALSAGLLPGNTGSEILPDVGRIVLFYGETVPVAALSSPGDIDLPKHAR